jgi:hypothetical protein
MAVTPSGLAILASISVALSDSKTDGTVYTGTPKLVNNNLPADAAIVYHGKLTVAAGNNQSLDLSGVLTDSFGNLVTFAKVYAVLVSNLNTITGNALEIGNSNFSTWLGTATDKIKIGPKGCLLLSSPVDGYVVTNSTGDTFKIANPGATAIDCSVLIVGK